MFEFIAAHIGAILLGLGGIGGIGLIAAVVAFGLPLASVAAAVLGVLQAFIKFLKTPVGQAVGIVALCALCLFIGDVRGTREELKNSAAKVAARDVYWKGEIDKAEKEFAARRKQRDAGVDDVVKGLVAQRLAELSAFSQSMQVHPDANDPANCVLRPSDLDSGVRAQAQRTAGAAKPKH